MDSPRDAYLFVPQAARRDTVLPLIVGLHGAGMRGMQVATFLEPLAQQFGLLVLAPDSRNVTWDAIDGNVGPDVEFLSRSIEACLARCQVDRRRVYLQGFSDGASYALTLGRVNGDFFKRIVAFCPGFVPARDDRLEGRPDCFIAHGSRDRILSVNNTRSRIAPQLRSEGFSVEYREFDGGHSVPAPVAAEAITWCVRPTPPAKD